MIYIFSKGKFLSVIVPKKNMSKIDKNFMFYIKIMSWVKNFCKFWIYNKQNQALSIYVEYLINDHLAVPNEKK